MDPKKPEVAKELTIDEKIAAAVKAARSDDMAAAVMAGVTAALQITQGPNASQRAEAAQAASQAAVDAKMRCADCGQLRAGCNYGEHAAMIVYPRNPHRGKHFPGLFLNGVQYISNSPSHRVCVPKANNFAYQIQEWEQSEESLLSGKTIDHNSGTIGGSQSNINPANYAGFSGPR